MEGGRAECEYVCGETERFRTFSFGGLEVKKKLVPAQFEDPIISILSCAPAVNSRLRSLLTLNSIWSPQGELEEVSLWEGEVSVQKFFPFFKKTEGGGGTEMGDFEGRSQRFS